MHELKNNTINETETVILIHGGTGRIYKELISPEKEQQYKEVLTHALNKGFKIINSGGKSIEAVEASIRILEDFPLFNAGKGAVYANNEMVELDAAIMDGKTLNAGSVAGTRTVKNPISAARKVMENSPHVMLVGRGADEFARLNSLEIVDQSYFKFEDRWIQIQKLKAESDKNNDIFPKVPDTKFGTVGAVSIDNYGSLAAGTSTGGMLNKKFGRVGDSPIIGAGTYANNVCAVSCTGHGEYFIRHAVAHDICAMMEYKSISVKKAAQEMIAGKLTKSGGVGGLIAMDANGNIAVDYNTEGMFYGFIKKDGTITVNVCNMIIE
ncbi:MAG: isoaspartyl peptidase/L-asparaginase [Bacteroidetes bacterium]|nr:isoaspartyl peptidase/L-asparaginase [Bacteroidota bacterium]HET6246017.1 isoaspartyl peptidase/L-asparaginase [Bacteroidia bacterium]